MFASDGRVETCVSSHRISDQVRDSLDVAVCPGTANAQRAIRVEGTSWKSDLGSFIRVYLDLHYFCFKLPTSKKILRVAARNPTIKERKR
jgi:hypothetical protein